MLTFQKFTKKILEIYAKKNWVERMIDWNDCTNEPTRNVGLWEQMNHRLVEANIPSACESKYTIGLREQMYEYHIGLWEQT